MVSWRDFPATREALEQLSIDDLDAWLQYARARRDAATAPITHRAWRAAVDWLESHSRAASLPKRRS